MVDEELKELLTDYKSMAESERSNFATEVVKNSNFANVVFNSLLAFEQERAKNTDILPPLCDLLYNIYRRDTEGKIFGLQFLPQLAFVYLLNYGDKEQFGCIETLLIGIHNIEAKDTSSFRIPNLAQNSIYHEAYQISDSSRIFVSPPDAGGGTTNLMTDTSRMGGGLGGNSLLTVKKVPPPQVRVLNSQNKQSVLAFLFNVYCSLLIDMSRHSVDFTCKLASRMVTRGFNIGSKKSHRRNVSYGSDQGLGAKISRILPNRLVLSSALLLELLHLGFFALMNQVANPGLTLIRDIEFRAKHASMDSVLLVSKALLKMAPNGPYLEEQRYISTPSQLSKNLITNASFRAKKLECDIPRVETSEDGSVVVGGSGVITGPGGQQIILDPNKMGVITEEDDGGQGEGGKKQINVENIADKIKARMENVRIPNAMRKKLDRNSESEGGHHHQSRNSEKRDKKKEKKEGKNSTASATSLQEPSSEPSSDEMKLAQLSLGGAPESETITIHSPESGTTSIF